MSRTHELKTWPIPFEGILDGTKKHEIRVDDRDFRVGDVLRLREWKVRIAEHGLFGDGEYTGREVTVHVTYKTRGGQWGLPADLCVMSIERVDAQERAA